MGTIGEHEQRFGGRVHRRRRVEQPATKIYPEWCVTWFEREERVAQLRHAPSLSALATDVDALKDEKEASIAQASSSRGV
jgi:hypothetical protein